MRRAWLSFLLLGSCLPDFDLEARKFACPPPPEVCAAGTACYGGYCIPAAMIPDAPQNDAVMIISYPDAGADAQPGVEQCHDGVDNNANGLIDCMDGACGIAACEDYNICTDQFCLPNGACGAVNVEANCGNGCQCAAGVRRETSCGDRTDNDGDALIDCRDTDCPTCDAIGLGVCCPDGSCAILTCLL